MSEYSDKLILNEKACRCILNAKDYIWSWYEGSAQCGKSVTGALALALLIENSKKDENLFLAIGYTASTARNNVAKCGGFGVEAYFGKKCKWCKYEETDYLCLKIKTDTGIKNLVFFGGSKENSNNPWHGWKVSAFILDEIDRLHKNSIEEAQQRVTTLDNPRFICTQNPNNPKHRIYKLLDSLLTNNKIDKYIHYEHWTLEDNAGMTPEKIERQKSMYDPNSIYYKRFILGLRVVADSLIYNIEDKNIFDKIDPNEYIKYSICMDIGETVSATAMNCMGLRKGFKGLDVLKEYYHKNAEHNQFRTLTEYCEDYAEFYLQCVDLLGKHPEYVIFDGSKSVEYEIMQAFRKYGIPTHRLKRATKSSGAINTINDRIRLAVSLLFKGQLRFHKSCVKTIESFRSAQYDPKKIDKGIEERLDEPQNGTLCDPLDTSDYNMLKLYKELNRCKIERKTDL